ncbi:hypothetical protein [Chryseobacterium nematophagum]|uniref:hypothetical protein n=1 Tax=Chryseobacterium nematophagum TaxID=2305228 RepID=UPI0011C35CF0|nr:hypothetical protein [Chryseobacterium nematophagum]
MIVGKKIEEKITIITLKHILYLYKTINKNIDNMENTNHNEKPKTNNILSKLQFTDDEKKEKFLLELAYYNHKVESNIEDKKQLKELKSIYADLENSLKEVIKFEVPAKNIKNYIQLKESAFDSDLLRLTKYLK